MTNGHKRTHVLVIGAQGVLGSFIARAFSQQGWHVTRAGRRPEDAPDFHLLDLDDTKALTSACADADLVVNTAHHPSLAPERTVLRNGGTLINLTELSPAARRGLAEAEADARGLVVTDAGMAGVSYLALADLLADHPQADGGEYALMFASSMSMGRAGAVFAHSLLAGSARHSTAVVPFPEPIGRRRCLEIGVSANAVLRSRVRGRPMRYYLLMQPPALQHFLLALNTLRLLSLLPQSVLTAGTSNVPDELTTERVCDWVAVTRAGARLATMTVEGEGYYRMTASATVAFAEALAERAGHPGASGLRAVDELLTLAEVRSRLEAYGVGVRNHGSHVPAARREPDVVMAADER